MKALILVDIQNDFMPGGSLAVTNGDRILAPIAAILPYFDLIVATQDWHPSDHKSFASQHEGKHPFEIITWDGLPQTLWPDHCVQDTNGADFHKELDISRAEAIFKKGSNSQIDSYSGFYDNARKADTGLHNYLAEHQVTEVYVCGLAADFCVYFTANDALSLGYTTTIISDATMPIDAKCWENIKEKFSNDGGKFITSEEIIK